MLTGLQTGGLELLLQRANDTYLLAPYDGDYVTQGECSGFDEMFPSIGRCFYEGYPWRGTPIPDHGEVWSIPWAWDQQDERLHLVTYGVRFPYRLEKWISFADDSTLRADYRLTNLSAFDLDFMWAAHMMLNLEEGAELALPDVVRKIVTALGVAGSLGRYGDEFQDQHFGHAGIEAHDIDVEAGDAQCVGLNIVPAPPKSVMTTLKGDPRKTPR